MTKRLVILIAVTTGALALPFTVKANEPSHNVGGERGVIFHDARSETPRSDTRAMGRSEQPGSSAWRYVGGEAVWIYEGPGNRATQERTRRADPALAPRTSERPFMQRALFANDIYHGA